jgi:hypothetical protein
MPIASRALVAAFACVLLVSSASAEVTDPEMTCAEYLKTVATNARTHKAGHATTGKTAADVEARIKAFCAANPKMKAMDAEMTVTGD